MAKCSFANWDSKHADGAPVRIMFVCHGNICRSTMAEFVMRDLANKAGLGESVVIASSATSTEEIGNPVHHGTKRILAKHGISCEGKRAVQLSWSDYEKYDLFVGMDSANIRNMRRMLHGDPDHKVAKLLQFSEGCDAERASDVADPWYTGNFEETWGDVLQGCTALLDFLAK